ncbi:MAG: glycosyltransferase [Coriobacteriia bacterium]|nr:glycosyltransferase [Coriobacteriia bacterium]
MPADTPLISILIPIFNAEEFLVECLDSVVNQKLTDFEAICINDGSTDSSREIIEQYLQADSRFRVIDKPNSGYGASLNRGLNEARGKYIAILESDDFYDLQILQKLYNSITQFDAQVAKANCYLYWSGPPKKNTFNHLVPRKQYAKLINPQVNHEIFYLQPSVWSALYSRDFLNDNDVRFLETPGASYQDTGFAFKVWFSATKVVYLPEALLHYRQDNMGSSINSPGKVYCVVDEHSEMDRYISSRPIPDWLPGVKTKMKYDTYLWNYERLAEEFKLEFLQHMAKELAEAEQLGQLDWSLFKEWQHADLQTILTSCEEYHRQRQMSDNRSKAGKAMHYLRVGGPMLLFKILLDKFFPAY